MTNTASFLAGLALGVSVASAACPLFLMWTIRQANKTRKDEGSETIELMRERNQLDREKIAQVTRVADELEFARRNK